MSAAEQQPTTAVAMIDHWFVSSQLADLSNVGRGNTAYDVDAPFLEMDKSDRRSEVSPEKMWST